MCDLTPRTEQLVKAAHAEVNAAKLAYTTSYSQQAASQKEVVGLLERKHSWSAADLERYMSLIRSEHLNEQAVQAAKEHLASTERHLEDARGKLEKRERKQYHEEQIWSDTIRRNSTWVTFGLMGLNIFLLLANLVIFEPWRRRRIVREIKTALDEKTTQAASLVPVAEAEVDKVVKPTEQPLEKIEEQVFDLIEASTEEVMPEATIEIAPDAQPEAMADSEVTVGETKLAAGEILPEEAVEISEPVVELIEVVEKAVEEPPQRPEAKNWEERLALWKDIFSAKLTFFKAKLQDLFSERQVAVKRIDVTTMALEGAAAGAAVVGILWALLNARP
jgi:sensitive to high expression protein 9